MIGLAVASGLVGLFPGAVLALAEPALRRLTTAGLDDRAGPADAWRRRPTCPAIPPPGIAAAAGAGGRAGGVAGAHAGRSQGHRIGPAWDCGFGAPPPWLPFGDPLTQYGGASFAQPLRRALGPALLHAQRNRGHAGARRNTRGAHVAVQTSDPAEGGLFRPVARLRVRLSEFADQLQFLTIRSTLSLMFAALVLFLAVIAVREQL